MPNLSPLAALFNLRPDRAADYLAAKGFKLSGPYWEMDGPQHSHLFTVANLAKMDVLTDIRSAVQKALDEGLTERWFSDQLVDVLKRKGWWGGKDGSLRRLHTIYATNLQTALMAGRHRQAMEQIDRAPWAQYMAIRDHRSRPAHAAMHGQIFRLDSPAWAAISPPCGYSCRCSARYLSDRELEKRGLKPAEDIQILEREPPGKMPVNPLTGATPQRWIQRGVSVPSKTNPGERDILWADPGWDHLPGSDGAERMLVDRLMAKATDIGDGVRMAVQAGLQEASKTLGIEAAASLARDDCLSWGRVNNRERMIVLDEATGKELARMDGEERAVSFGKDVEKIMDDKNQSVRLIHNHPSDTSFSSADFNALGWDGVHSIEAVGHDGSRFTALHPLGKRTEFETIADAWHYANNATIFENIRTGRKMPIDLANWAHFHCVAQGLSEAGFIRYEAILSPGKIEALAPFKEILDRLIAAAKKAAEKAK